MRIKDILEDFSTELNKICTEENKHKPIMFEVCWRSTKYNTHTIDMSESYWYLEDDGTIVFRINDDIGIDNEYKLKVGTLVEFQSNLNKFLNDFGDKEQIVDEYMEEAKDVFYFYTADGSYWVVSEFKFIVDEMSVLIDINDWG